NASNAPAGDHEIPVRRFGLLAFACLAASAADFNKDVRPVLEQNCTACHGAIRQLGSIRLDTPAGFERATAKAVLSSIESGKMPPGEKLTPPELTAIRDWIKSGAAWPSGIVIDTGGAGAGGADNLGL